MNKDTLLEKALNFDFLTIKEGLFLFENSPTAELIFIANELRKQQVPGKKVTWIIDRNVNITNVCVANCKFCNFFVPPKHQDGYITTIDQYKEKIEEMIHLGGDQLLLQGGHHPELGLSFYTDLFKELKQLFPQIKLHACGPPEIVHIAKMEKLSYSEVLTALIEAGMDTFPGSGSEILVDRVRRLISNGKCTTGEWLDVMRAAHQLRIVTSATMMFGHVETIEERMQHLVAIREVQSEKPKDTPGFMAFIPWTFQHANTLLNKTRGTVNDVTKDEYIRMVAMSRIMLPNIKNIQASWLTVGKETAQMCLHGGANDMGSVMIEENVVSAAGATYNFTTTEIQEAIREAGFEPQLRTQEYEERKMPEAIIE